MHSDVSPEHPDARPAPGPALLTVFSVLWAAGFLFHVASYNLWGRDRWLVFAAAAVLLLPRSVLALSVLAAVQVASSWHASPVVANHYLFAACVNAAILLSVALLVLRTGSLRIRGADLIDTFGPPVRIGVVVLYAFVVFHKLNSDFFDPEFSCGTMFYKAQAERLAFLPSPGEVGVGAIVIALAFEALIPILLVCRSTRYLGVVVAASFHYVLGLNPLDGFYNFSSLLLALFALFGASGPLEHGMRRLGPRRWHALTVLLLGTLALAAITQKYVPAALGRLDPFLIVWTAYGGAICVLFAWCAHRGWVTRGVTGGSPAMFRLREPMTAVVPVLVALNGLSPYLGLKTETSWAMFSNLRTEGGQSNHYLMPASVQVFSYQRDLVRIRSSSNRYLQSLAQQGLLVPRFEIQRRQPAAVTLIQDGGDVPADASAEPPGLLLQKLLWFRPLDPGRQRCRH